MPATTTSDMRTTAFFLRHAKFGFGPDSCGAANLLLVHFDRVAIGHVEM
jgi:hypothetical protein